MAHVCPYEIYPMRLQSIIKMYKIIIEKNKETVLRLAGLKISIPAWLLSDDVSLPHQSAYQQHSGNQQGTEM